jgi:hypothetical protein
VSGSIPEQPLNYKQYNNMGKKAMINALTEAFNKSKNSCVKITLRNYIETVETLSESEYKEAEGFYIEALNRWG